MSNFAQVPSCLQQSIELEDIWKAAHFSSAFERRDYTVSFSQLNAHWTVTAVLLWKKGSAKKP